MEKDIVLVDFENRINPWCAEQAKAKKIPKEQMCQYAISVFSDDYSESWIRSLIRPEFKIGYKSSNAKERIVNKSKKIDKLYKFAKKHGFQIVGTVIEAVEPLHETGLLITRAEKEQ